MSFPNFSGTESPIISIASPIISIAPPIISIASPIISIASPEIVEEKLDLHVREKLKKVFNRILELINLILSSDVIVFNDIERLRDLNYSLNWTKKAIKFRISSNLSDHEKSRINAKFSVQVDSLAKDLFMRLF